MSETLYAIMGIPPASTTEQIRARYKILVRAMHPDIGGDTGMFAKVTHAGSILTDEGRRENYDALLKLTMDPCPVCEGRGVNFRQITFTEKAPIECAACDGEGWNERY